MSGQALLAHRLAVTERLAGHPNAFIAKYLRVTVRSIERYRKRLGLPAWDNRDEVYLTHGPGGYNRGCRCSECSSASARLHAEWMQNHGPLTADDSRHGTNNGYTNWGCRCAPCTAAKVIENRRQADDRKRRAAS